MRTDGRTDIKKLIVAFRNYKNAPTDSTLCPHSVFVFCVDLRTNSAYFPIQR
jgi:hypothetical protein